MSAPESTRQTLIPDEGLTDAPASTEPGAYEFDVDTAVNPDGTSELAWARLESDARADLEIRVRVLLDALKSLARLHTQMTLPPKERCCGVVEPEDILVAGNGVASLGVKERLGTVLTESRVDSVFAAPEVRSGASFDQQADLYSIGVLLWKMLGGATEPSPGWPSEEEQTKLVEQQPEWAAGLVAVAVRGLDKEPSERPVSARHFAHQIERCARGHVAPRSRVAELVREPTAAAQELAPAEPSSPSPAVNTGAPSHDQDEGSQLRAPAALSGNALQGELLSSDGSPEEPITQIGEPEARTTRGSDSPAHAPIVIYQTASESLVVPPARPFYFGRSWLFLAITVALTAGLSFWIGSWASNRTLEESRAKGAASDDAASDESRQGEPEKESLRPAESGRGESEPGSEAPASGEGEGASKRAGRTDDPAQGAAQAGRVGSAAAGAGTGGGTNASKNALKSAPGGSPKRPASKAAKKKSRYEPMGI